MSVTLFLWTSSENLPAERQQENSGTVGQKRAPPVPGIHFLWVVTVADAVDQVCDNQSDCLCGLVVVIVVVRAAVTMGHLLDCDWCSAQVYIVSSWGV